MKKLDFKEQLIIILVGMNVALAFLVTGTYLNMMDAIEERNESYDKLENAYDTIDWLLEMEQKIQEQNERYNWSS